MINRHPAKFTAGIGVGKGDTQFINVYVKQCRRDFRKGNNNEIRKSLALIDGNDKMKNKTATECWNNLRGELDSAIDSYFPMKKQGKRSKKKHLSKEAFRKIRHKLNNVDGL